MPRWLVVLVVLAALGLQVAVVAVTYSIAFDNGRRDVICDPGGTIDPARGFCD